ncbi:MAG: TssQ family T6SS-associated lipoprotein [Sulfuriferula sp.]
MPIRLLFFCLIAAILASACSSAPIREIGLDRLAPRKAEQALSTGLKDYENGHYQLAAKNLQSALDNELTFKKDRVTAHKYLAFVYCVTDRKKQCRDQFRDAMEIDPDFELSASEAGHPIWGPVFREVRAEQGLQKR